MAYEACRCSRIASRGSSLLPSQWAGGHDVIEPNAITKQRTEEICRASGSRRQKSSATDRSLSPSPFSYIASFHHPSIRGRFTESHTRKCAGVLCLGACSYPSPTTTHLIACICAGAGGFQGAGAGGLIDPTVCAEVSDESTGPVRSAMEPQWKGSMTNGAERLRKVPSIFKGTESGREDWAEEEDSLRLLPSSFKDFYRDNYYYYNTDMLLKLCTARQLGVE